MKTADWQTWPVLGHWTIEADHPVLEGHFPSHPVVPGALLLSWAISLAQRATGLTYHGLKNVRFSGAVTPGTPIELRASSAADSVRFAIVDTESTPRVVASGMLTSNEGPAS